MTVDFALFISPEGIALAHRQAAGHWALIAEARLDDGDLDAAMSVLRRAAETRGGAKAPVLVVLPDDQVLYTSVTAPVEDTGQVVDRITEGLDGMTPYAVSELVYDWRAVDIDRVKVAVVAQETLGEATQFVAAHGFEAAGFLAMPPAERFPGMPLFGAAQADWGLDGAGMAFGADDWVDPALAAQQAKAAEDEAAAKAKVAPAKVAPAEPESAKGEDHPETGEIIAPVSQDEPRNAAQDDPVQSFAAADPAAGQGPQDKPEAQDSAEDEQPLTPIADLSLGQPIAPLAAEDAPQPDSAPEDAGTGVDRATQPQLDLPQPAKDAPAPSSKPDAPTATRAKPAGPARRGAIDRPTPPQATEPPPNGDAPPESEPETGLGPALGFSARRGKAPRPDSGAGDIVSTRRSRLGFGTAAPTGPAPVLHPDAAPSRAPSAKPVAPSAPVPAPASGSPRAPGPARGPAAPTKPAGRLVAQLARVRDASKAKLRPASATPAPPPSRPKPPAPDQTEKPRDGGRSVFGLQVPGLPGRRAASKPQGAAPPPTTGDTALTHGLLARKPVDPPGPSLRMGLVLTLVLLVLLALIAVWSALFLPDSPMARLFSGGSDRDTAAVTDDQPVAPPRVVTAPPAIDELDSGTATTALRDAPAARADDTAQTTAEAPPIAPPPEPVAAVLPDIDADLDLPPLAPLPEDLLPSREDTERIYAEDGIWPRPPERPDLTPLGSTIEIYVASIDPEVPAIDAIALSDPAINPAEVLRRVPPPPPFGTDLDRNARGLVIPTPEGVLTPEGAFVVLGRPAVDAVPRPRELAPAVQAEPETGLQDAILGTFAPRQRPADLDETRQRQVQGGFSDRELAGLRPGPRPVSAQDAAARASLFPQAPAPATAGNAPATDTPAAVTGGTDLAVAASRLPRARPGNIAALVAAAEADPGPAVVPEQVARAPSIPSSADVTRAATETNAIRLRDINLIGVTGTPSDRRALVRLPSGRFVRVGVGDRLDGGRVAAIGEGSLQYVRNGRNVTLEIPG